ncbi:MAG: UbiA family prenyltransferase [Calditrichaeota bacterium]|nr:UbiA family prenyltransferase [Calditrichota bacterium]
MIRRLKNIWNISRPLNVFIAFLTIWIAAFISPDFHLNYKLILGSIAAALITCGANIINDIFDVEIDRINKPDRPLPGGTVSIREAWIYFSVSYVLAFILAAFCDARMFAVAVIIGILLIVYSAWLKRTVLWGNLTVSLATAVAFIYGAMAVGDWKIGLIPATFAFFFHLGRELIKDMQDLEGDLKNKSVTFPGKFGIKSSIVLVNIIFIFLIPLTVLPYILQVYGFVYLMIVILGVHTVLIFTNVFLWIRNDRVTLGRISHLLKLDMLIGLIAIYFGT